MLVRATVTIDIEVDDEIKPNLAEDAASESVLAALRGIQKAKYICVDAKHVPRRSDKLKQGSEESK